MEACSQRCGPRVSFGCRWGARSQSWTPRRSCPSPRCRRRRRWRRRWRRRRRGGPRRRGAGRERAGRYAPELVVVGTHQWHHCRVCAAPPPSTIGDALSLRGASPVATSASPASALRDRHEGGARGDRRCCGGGWRAGGAHRECHGEPRGSPQRSRSACEDTLAVRFCARAGVLAALHRGPSGTALAKSVTSGSQ